MDFLLHYIIDELLKLYPDSIKLMFIKCYLTIIYKKNRFTCLTLITTIENLNHKYSFFD
jgi:hypothetical protein